MGGRKDDRGVKVVTVLTVTVPVRRGKNSFSIRYPDLEEASRLAKGMGGGKILFDFQGESDLVDIGLSVIGEEAAEVTSPPMSEVVEK